MSSIMVAGGAGYIGSHCLRLLLDRGLEAFAYDNLSEGHRPAVLDADLVVGDLSDTSKLVKEMRERNVGTVFHFAASCYVGESVKDPGKYYENNVFQAKRLLDAMREADVRRIVFSSTCATYGNPQGDRMDESHPQFPANPYGWSKLMAERLMLDYGTAYGLRSVFLRYFNAAGADPDGKLGEDHDPETHLIPLILQALLGEREKLSVFGDDYDTPDGTCIRDYIHIMDLADAHLLALDHLDRIGQTEGGGNDAFNLGNGEGYSVLEVIRAAEAVTDRKVPFEIAPRRAGDPARLVGEAARAREVLGWSPRLGDLEAILRTAWAWHSAHPKGYEE